MRPSAETRQQPKSEQQTSTSSNASPQAGTASVQLKQSLRGHDFAAQEQMLSPEAGAVQAKGEAGGADVHAAAAHGVSGGGGAMPHGAAIQQAFGRHDVSGVKAHVGGAAREASEAMGAQAYATGDRVAFKGAPDLHTAAHEAAHVVQQRAGVSLSGGVGKSGDGYEKHADQVADAVVAGKNAEGILDTMTGGGGGGVQKKAVQMDATNGITGGKASIEDFAGGAISSERQEEAKSNIQDADSKTIDQIAREMRGKLNPTGTFNGRGEAEMLAAIASKQMPRYVARVGNEAYFTEGGRFGGGRDGQRPFIFATEPSDLMGLKPAAAMLKVGWTMEWIEKAVGQSIGICIFDTQKAVPSETDSSQKKKVGMGEMGWTEIRAKAKGDSDFISNVRGKGVDVGKLDEVFDILEKTPVKAAPRTSDPNLKVAAVKTRAALNELYGANELYSGMGATIQEDGQLGAREVMLTNCGTNFPLTTENFRVVSLGTLGELEVKGLKRALGL